MQVGGKWSAFPIRNLQRARSLGHLVQRHDDEEAGIHIGFDDHNPRMLPMNSVNHKTVLDDASGKVGSDGTCVGRWHLLVRGAPLGAIQERGRYEKLSRFGPTTLHVVDLFLDGQSSNP